MIFPQLLISDLHLDDDKKNEYRWDFFKWINSVIKTHNIKRLMILGDLTEKKDRHSSKLVNRIMDNLMYLISKHNLDIVIIGGNHDYIDKTMPFFKFMRMVDKVLFVYKPIENGEELYLPHSDDPVVDWKDIDFDKFKRVYMHQPTVGVRLMNGKVLDSGLPNDLFSDYNGKVYSGDIHVPQDIGNVRYIGSPYPVYFGDDYNGRVLILESRGKEISVLYPTIKRVSWTITGLDELKGKDLQKGDHAKVRVMLTQSNKYEWFQMRQQIKQWFLEKGVELYSLELVIEKPKTQLRKARIVGEQRKGEGVSNTLRRFSQYQKLSEEQLNIGLSIIEEML